MANSVTLCVSRSRAGAADLDGTADDPGSTRSMALPMACGFGAAGHALCAPTGAELRRMARRHEVVPHRDDRRTRRRARRYRASSMLKQAYARALGIPVEIFVARDYAALIDAQATARVDYAIYSTTAYATAALLCACVEPVVAPVGEDGATGIKAILVTRDGRLSKLADIEHAPGRHRALDSIAGFALPRLELAVGQVALTGAEPFLVHADSASAAEAMLVDGSVDAIFGWLPANADDRVSRRHAGAAGSCGHGRGLAVGGVEIGAAPIRPARLAFRSRRRAAHDARRVPDRAQGNRSPMSTTSSKRIVAAASRKFAPATMRRRSTWCGAHATRDADRSSGAGSRKLAVTLYTSHRDHRNGARLACRSAIGAGHLRAHARPQIVGLRSSRCRRRPPPGRAAACPPRPR